MPDFDQEIPAPEKEQLTAGCFSANLSDYFYISDICMTTRSQQRYLIVVNPIANNKAEKYLSQLTDLLQQKDLPFRVWYTAVSEQASLHHLQDCLTDYTDWIMIGGDGTLNLLANALAGSDIPLGIIPCGSGNDFVRTLLPAQTDPVQVALFGEHTKVDLGKCNGRYFTNVLGVGFDGELIATYRGRHAKRFRQWRYFLQAVNTLFSYREKPASMQSTRKKQGDLFIAAFGNGRFFGSGMQITPKAKLDDGKLDCCWVGKTSLLRKLYYLSKIRSGAHIKAAGVDYWQDDTFQISTPGLAIEGDGEDFGTTPAKITVEAAALTVKTNATSKTHPN